MMAGLALYSMYWNKRRSTYPVSEWPPTTRGWPETIDPLRITKSNACFTLSATRLCSKYFVIRNRAMVQQKLALPSVHKPSLSLWTKSFMKHRRSGFFIAMNDSYACIPPGTPISLESNRTATTHASSGFGIGIGETESIVSRGVTSKDNAVGDGTTERRSVPPLPNLRNLKRCSQFNPPNSATNDIDDDDRHDATSVSISNQTSNTIACTDTSLQHRLRPARPLTIRDDENPLNLGSMENDDEPPMELAVILEHNENQNLELDPSMQVLDRSKDSEPIPPSSLFYIMEQEQRLSSIPKEIVIPTSQLDDDEDDDSIPEEPFTQVSVDKANYSAHCIRPSPRDVPRQRRQQRSYVQLDINGFVCEEGKEEMPCDISFTDIVCRHVKRSHSVSVTISSVEDECSLPLYIEVKGASAPRSNFIWRTHFAPEYASV